VVWLLEALNGIAVVTRHPFGESPVLSWSSHDLVREFPVGSSAGIRVCELQTNVLIAEWA
jgi:hypothetical protein